MQNTIKSILLNIGFCLQDTETISQDIIATYNDSERGYHDITHITNMLNGFEDFIKNSADKYKISDINKFAFAILMHDYVNGTNNDIEASINKSKQFLHTISPDYDYAYIEKLIRATDYEQYIQPDFEQQLIQDLDLTILGSDSTEYDEYASKIRMQYNKYPDTIFNPRRINILNIFLSKEHIYNLTYFRDKYETTARNNLKREIQKLRN